MGFVAPLSEADLVTSQELFHRCQELTRVCDALLTRSGSGANVTS